MTNFREMAEKLWYAINEAGYPPDATPGDEELMEAALRRARDDGIAELKAKGDRLAEALRNMINYENPPTDEKLAREALKEWEGE